MGCVPGGSVGECVEGCHRSESANQNSPCKKGAGLNPGRPRKESRRYQGVPAGLRRSALMLGPRGCPADTAFLAAVLATKVI